MGAGAGAGAGIPACINVSKSNAVLNPQWTPLIFEKSSNSFDQNEFRCK